MLIGFESPTPSWRPFLLHTCLMPCNMHAACICSATQRELWPARCAQGAHWQNWQLLEASKEVSTIQTVYYVRQKQRVDAVVAVGNGAMNIAQVTCWRQQEKQLTHSKRRKKKVSTSSAQGAKMRLQKQNVAIDRNLSFLPDNGTFSPL